MTPPRPARTLHAFAVGLVLLAAPGAFAQTNPPPAKPKLGAIVAGVLNRQTGAIAGKSVLSAADADSGLREALNLGAANVVAQLSKPDGYFKDPKIKIPLPPRLAKVQAALGPIGGLSALNDLQLKMNRAAEAAAPEAKTLFISAIKGMTLSDAIQIVKGPPDGATQFLKARTESQVQAAFRPFMERGLSETGAFKAMDKASAQFGAAGLAGDARTSLTDFALKAATDGMFYYIGEQEKAIRADPARQTTALLRKVFGAAK